MQNVLERMEAIGAERKMADFNVKMKMDYEFKKNYAYIRAWEFYNECCARGLNCHVSVGGLTALHCSCSCGASGFMYPASVCPIWRTGAYRRYIDSLGLRGFSR